MKAKYLVRQKKSLLKRQVSGSVKKLKPTWWTSITNEHRSGSAQNYWAYKRKVNRCG